MENLTRSSKIWPKIKEALQKQDALATHLTLRCQIHPSVFTRVSSAADFHKVPEGGCLQICGAALQCGHTCKSVCHVRNREHGNDGNVRCSEQCERWGEVLHVWRWQFMSELEQQKEHSRCACGINTISFIFSLTHSRQLQHWTVCVGFELDSTALEDKGSEFLQNTNCVVQSHIAEDKILSSFRTLTALYRIT